MQSKFIKVITVIIFFILITGFVAYRSDAFEIEETNEKIQLDSPIVNRKDPAMLSSSKSIVLINKSKNKMLDSASQKKITRKNNDTESVILQHDIMSSSKSMILVSPKTLSSTPPVSPAQKKQK